MMAVEDVEAGDEVMRIPLRLIITPRLVLASPRVRTRSLRTATTTQILFSLTFTGVEEVLIWLSSFSNASISLCHFPF